jgi:tetratricopeptide (TPR) repeat protein
VLAFVPKSHAQTRHRDPFNWQSCNVLDGLLLRGKGETGGVRVEVRRFSEPLPQSTGISNGSFTFTCLAEGTYDLRVIDAQGKIIHAELTEVGPGANSVQVLMSGPQTPGSDSPVVSIRQLMRKSDAKAERDIRKAYAALERQRFDEAVGHSQRALSRDPENPQALVGLGEAYAGLKRYEEAADQFARAAKVDPDSLSAHSNLAIVMLRRQRWDAAEQAARRALNIAHPLPQMHYVLGLSLGLQRRNIEEAIENLDRAATAYPRARVAAVRVLMDAGRRTDAAGRLELYLRSSDGGEERKELESLLAQIR